MTGIFCSVLRTKPSKPRPRKIASLQYYSRGANVDHFRLHNPPSTTRCFHVRMETLGIESKPSSLNILKRFYTRVIPLEEYLRRNVSENRFEKITSAAKENKRMKTLIQTTLVCVNPRIHITDETDPFMDEISILTVGEHATQSEVNIFAFNGDRRS